MSQSTSWHPETFIQLTEYREVEEILRRGRDFVLDGTKFESDEFVHGTLIAMDGRDHLARRRGLMKMISPAQPWGPEGTLVDKVFEHAMSRVRNAAPVRDGFHHFDLVEFCRGIVWRVTAALVGLDGVDDDDRVTELVALATPILKVLAVEYLPEDQREPVVVAAREAAERIRSDLFLPSLERRQAALRRAGEAGTSAEDLPADLITSMLASGEHDVADMEPVFRELMQLVAASVNNPVSQLAWAIDDLEGWVQDHPLDSARLGEREFLNMAVKETMRLHRSSRPYLVRIAVDDAVLESTGRAIPKGSWVAGWLEAANHDRTVFGEDADSYNPYRKPLDPKVQPFGLAFGSGPHVCLGRPMLLWEQGDEHAQGMQTKILRLLLSEGVRRDPEGVREEAGEPGGRRYARYDVRVPVRGW
jgi:cytochrome P450